MPRIEATPRDPDKRDAPTVEAVQSPPEPKAEPRAEPERGDESKAEKREFRGVLARLDDRARNEMLRIEKEMQEHDKETAKATEKRAAEADKDRRAVDSGKAKHFETVTYREKD